MARRPSMKSRRSRGASDVKFWRYATSVSLSATIQNDPVEEYLLIIRIRYHNNEQADARTVPVEKTPEKVYDVALLTEVIEHLDPDRLRSLVRVVFEFARPRRVALTTPNTAYNSVWPSLPAGKFRHPDHRFEWTRKEFQAWAAPVAASHGYAVTFSGIGTEDPEGRGTPTQMAVFDHATA